MTIRRDIQQTSFVAGEWSPWVRARTDSEKYTQAAGLLRNMTVTRQGPATRRMGSRYVGSLDLPTRLLPFDVSRNRSYVLAMQPGRMRIYAERGLVLNDDHSVYEVTTPYTAEDLPNLRTARVGDVMWIASGSRQPQKLSRHGDTDWRLEAVTLTFGRTDAVILSEGQGWPSVVAFHDNRLCFAATRLRPQTIWMSQTGLYDRFDEHKIYNPLTEINEIAPDSRLILVLAGQEADSIEWMISTQRGLMVGTGGSEWLVGSKGGAITPFDAVARPASSRGSTDAEPLRIDQEVLFVDRSGEAVRVVGYDFERDGMRSQDLSFFARHLFGGARGEIQELTWQREPDSLVWARLSTGALTTCAYDRDQGVAAWSRHDLGGEGKVRSITSIPAPRSGRRDLWLVVERGEGVDQVRTIEFIPGVPARPSPGEDAFVDGAVFYEGDASARLTGFGHMAGRRVSIVGDGARLPDVTITPGGAAELSASVTRAVIGLPYLSQLRTLPVGASRLGSWAGNETRYHEIVVDLYRTMEGVEAASGSGRGDPVALRVVDSVMDDVPVLRTGPARLPWSGAIEPLPVVELRTEGPGPMTIRGILVRLTGAER